MSLEIGIGMRWNENFGCAAGVPVPPEEGEEGEMHVVPIPLHFVKAISTLRINLPIDLRNQDHRKAAYLTIKVPFKAATLKNYRLSVH